MVESYNQTGFTETVDMSDLTCDSRALAAEAEGIRAMRVAKINTILIIAGKGLCNLRCRCEYSLLLEFMFVECASLETGVKLVLAMGNNMMRLSS